MKTTPIGKYEFNRVVVISIFLFVLMTGGAIGDFVRNGHAGHGESTKPMPHDLGEIVVIGEKIDEFIEKNSSQVVSINAREIEERNFLQVYEVLGSMSGVDVKQGSSGLGARISIRGGGGSGAVLVLIDGRPAATLQNGGVDLSSVPIDIVEKITIFKPPVPVWLGPGSSAGAVFIETKQKKARVKSEKTGRIRVSAGSYGLAKASATAKLDSPKSQVMISGGLSHKDGKRDNSQRDQGHFSLNYDKKNGGNALQINGKTYVSDHGVSGPVYNPTPNAWQRYEKASADVRVKGMADTLDYTFKSWADIKQLDERAENGDRSTLDTLTAGIGTDCSLWDRSEKNEFRFGGQFDHNQVDHTLSGKHHRNRISGHTEYTLRTDPMAFTLGARGDYSNDFHFSPGGHAGISYGLSENTLLKTNVGYSENIPSFGQLYQPVHGSMDQVRGNPDLEMEEIVSVTLGVEHRIREKHKLACSLFRTETRDLIVYQRGEDNIKRPENIDKAFKQGIETTAKIVVSDRTSVDVTHIWQNTENKSNGRDLTYSPTHSIKLIFKTALKTGTKLEGTLRGYSEQYSDTLNTEDEKIDDYVAMDAKVVHPVVAFSKKGLVFAHFHNLFDTDYSSHYGYPDDGFKLECGVSLNF